MTIHKRSNPLRKAATSTLATALTVTLFFSPAVLPESFGTSASISQAAVFDLNHTLMNAANRYYGTPYQFGADPNQTAFFDCSSYTQRVFSHIGVTLPRTSSQQYQLGHAVNWNEAQIGDLVFFHENGSGVPSHVGIYAGNHRMINATVSKGVITVDLTTSYWQSRFLGIKRVLPEQTTVLSGDTLWKISARTGASISQLKEWNDIPQDMIRYGQTLYLANPNLTANPSVPAAGSSNNTIHTVKAGDTLWIIANKYGITIDQLKRWNKLTSDMIMVGQVLRISEPNL